MAKPSIGRIVHFRSLQNDVCPAIITRVFTDTMVNLTIFPDNAMPVARTSVPFDADFKAPVTAMGSWSWPVTV